MGVLTKLSLEQINDLIKIENIKFDFVKETLNGTTDSTYIGFAKENKKYVLKLFETSNIKEVQQQILILKSLEEFNVPKVVSKELNLYKKRPVALFSFIEGNIAKSITPKHIEQIVEFLLELHLTKSIKPNNENIYKKRNLFNMIDSIKNSDLKEDLLNRYNKISSISLEDDGLIHGDLFPDNAKFRDGVLAGVYDFSHSCYGNTLFDLAVVIVSWCFNDFEFDKELFNKALQVYGKKRDITQKSIKEYLLYASLFYTVQRVNRNSSKDYKEYLKKFDILEEIL